MSIDRLKEILKIAISELSEIEDYTLEELIEIVPMSEEEYDAIMGNEYFFEKCMKELEKSLGSGKPLIQDWLDEEEYYDVELSVGLE